MAKDVARVVERLRVEPGSAGDLARRDPGDRGASASLGISGQRAAATQAWRLCSGEDEVSPSIRGQTAPAWRNVARRTARGAEMRRKSAKATGTVSGVEGISEVP